MGKGPNTSDENPTALKVQHEAVTRSLKQKPELIVLQATDPSVCVCRERTTFSASFVQQRIHTCHLIAPICACFGFCSREITSLTGTLCLCMDSFYSALENLSSQKSAGYITQWSCAVCLLPRHVCSALFTSLAALVESCETSLHRDCAWGKGSCIEAERDLLVLMLWLLHSIIGGFCSHARTLQSSISIISWHTCVTHIHRNLFITVVGWQHISQRVMLSVGDGCGFKAAIWGLGLSSDHQ